MIRLGHNALFLLANRKWNLFSHWFKKSCLLTYLPKRLSLGVQCTSSALDSIIDLSSVGQSRVIISLVKSMHFMKAPRVAMFYSQTFCLCKNCKKFWILLFSFIVSLFYISDRDLSKSKASPHITPNLI